MVIDMHSHILPGLDDGPADWEQAIAMARVAVNDGITEMVCTPHWILGMYENHRETVLGRLAEFEERLAAEKIPLMIHSGMEIRIDASIQNRLKTGELLTLNNGGVYVLLELPDENIPSNFDEFFRSLQSSGYRPILSHVERNPIWRENPRSLFTLVENGILTQVTAVSLLEGFVEEIREFALFLVEHRLVHMVVTDTHSLRMRKPQLSGACSVIEKLMGPETVTRMVSETPGHILRGEQVPVVDPIPLEELRKKKSFWSFLQKHP
jgi:protein-tyrosine phosphatase